MKNGSAVRFFVNLPPRIFTHPIEEGYLFCKECDRYVHKNNIHCYKCKGCMSKVRLNYNLNYIFTESPKFVNLQ